MTKNFVCYTPYLKNHISYDCHLWKACIKWCFFHFFKSLIFWVRRGVKGQKTVQNDKKLCLSCTISQEPCIIWLSFLVQMCKIVSPGVFFQCQNFDFPGCQGAESAKNGPKWQKKLSITPYISGTICHMIFIYGALVCIKG